MTINGKILIVDDEETIRVVLADALESHHYYVVQAANADLAALECETQQFDVALVDLRMPGEMDGIALMHKLRLRTPPVDVIILTAYATLDTSLKALRQGAYDYLLKPVSTVQVLETVKRLMDKREDEQQRQRVIVEIEQLLGQLKGQSLQNLVDNNQIVKTQTLMIDFQKRLVVRQGEPLTLTPTEFDMLAYLAMNSDRVVSCRELIQAAQGYQSSEDEARPIVRVNIRRLRQKIEADPKNPIYIQTMRDRGYRFVPG